MSVIKFTFKVVQSRALANRTFYFIKLFIELCVDVRIRITCYPAGPTRPRMEKKKIWNLLSLFHFKCSHAKVSVSI